MADSDRGSWTWGLRQRLSFLKPLVWVFVGKPPAQDAFAVHVERLKTLTTAQAAGEVVRLNALIASESVSPTSDQALVIALKALECDQLALCASLLSYAAGIDVSSIEKAAYPLARWTLDGGAAGESRVARLHAAFSGPELGRLLGDRFHAHRGRTLMASGDVDGAMSAFAQAAKLNPACVAEFGQPIYDFAFAPGRTGRPHAVLSRMLDVLAAGAPGLERRLGASFYVACARRLLDAADLDGALECFGKAAIANPGIEVEFGQPLYDYMFSPEHTADLQENLAKVLGKFPPAAPKPGLASSSLNSGLSADFHFAVATRLLKDYGFGQAAPSFQHALSIRPEVSAQLGQPLFDHIVGDPLPSRAYARVTEEFPLRRRPDNTMVCALDAQVFLSLGQHFMATRVVGAGIDAFHRAASLRADMAVHFGQPLFDAVTSGELTTPEIEAIIEKLGRKPNHLVPDLQSAIVRELGNRADADADVVRTLLNAMDHGSLIELGNRALGEAKHRLAIAAYNAAISKKPQDILTRLQIGVTYYLANLHAEADANFAVVRSLQAAERARYGVADKAGRVLHNTWIQAIGHIACLDTYIKAQKLGWLPDQRPVLAFDPRNPPAGMSVLSRWAQFIDVVGVAGDAGPVIDEMVLGRRSDALDPGSRDLRRVAMMDFFWALPNKDGKMRYYGAIGSDVQFAWKESGRGPLLSVSDEENRLFRATMEQAFGLPRDAWFVLLHVREAGFKTDWEAHHRYTRNAEIETYDLAIEHIVKAGGWVIRGGDPSMKPIRPRPGVIDYAVSPLRSPELDVLLCAQAKFFLGTNSGFSLVPPLFGTRCALTNWSPLANFNWYPDDIVLPKHILNRATGEPLPYAEAFKSLAAWSQFERDFQTDWQVVDNTPEEILMVTRELLAQIDDGVVPSAEDLALQERFNAIVLEGGGYLGSWLSTGFIRANPGIFGPVARSPAVAGTPGPSAQNPDPAALQDRVSTPGALVASTAPTADPAKPSLQPTRGGRSKRGPVRA